MPPNKPSNPNPQKKVRKAPVPDKRPAHVIFATRTNNELRMLGRRFGNLKKIANARKATPTREQVDALTKYLRDGSDAVIRAFEERLAEQTSERQKESGVPQTFGVIPGAEVPVPRRTRKTTPAIATA